MKDMTMANAPSSPGVQAVAEALVSARRSGQSADATPFATALPDAPAAYAVQEQVARALEGGMPSQRFWKSGGPSREAVLTHAALPPAGVWESPADARRWPFHLRLIEAEVALRLGTDVTPSGAAALDVASAEALVDAMAVSIEVVDSRWRQGRDTPALLKLADLQAHGALVLGAWVPYRARDWSAQRCSVRIGSAPAAEFTGTHSLGEPAWLLPAWLRHATRHGDTVAAGTVVTTGTWCGLLPAAAGDEVVAVFEGIGEARVRL